MANIQLKRGPSKNLETAKASMASGEPAFATDTGKLYVFDGTNLILINVDQVDVPDASLTVAGIVMLSSAVNSDDESKASTLKAVKAAYDLAASKAGKTTATASAAGLMSAADKAKVDALGTAASKDVGTAAGNVVAVGSDGKLPVAVIPAIALSETFAVSSQTAMLALNAQPGDVAIRSDSKKSYILSRSPASTLANWLELLRPDCKVLSVAGRTGAVVLTADDVGLGNVDNTSDANKPISTATQTALNTKAPLASPMLTGIPKAPTVAAATNNTQIATTAYVKAQGYLTAASTIDGGTF